MPVRLVMEAGPHAGVSAREMTRRARAMLAGLKLPTAELSIVLTGDDQIKKLNRQWRKKNKATDVLAFALREGEFGALSGDLLGDVVISIPTARRQAEEAGRPLVAEVTMLLAHGLLHLLGWDHDTVAKDRAMRRETDLLCTRAEKKRRTPLRTQRRDGKPRQTR